MDGCGWVGGWVGGCRWVGIGGWMWVGVGGCRWVGGWSGSIFWLLKRGENFTQALKIQIK